MALSDLVPVVKGPALEIEIDPGITEGLEAPQVAKMQDTIYKIKSGNARFIVESAFLLHELRNAIKGSKKNDPRQWSKFKSSNLVPFNKREITDLVAGWEGWLSHSQLPPEKFNLVGIRTIQKIGAASAGIQKEVEAQLMKNARVTEKYVRELTGEKAKSTRARRTSASQSMTIAKAKRRIIELENENKQLRNLLDKYKIEYSLTSALKKKAKV